MSEPHVRELPDGTYRIEVETSGSKQLAGYLWIVKDGAKYYNYFVTLKQYLPPITGVNASIFNYSPPELPSGFSSLSDFYDDAKTLILAEYPGADVEKQARLEVETDWAMP